MRARLMRWHKRIGIAAAVLVALLSITGVLVQHADALGLARRHVRAAWLLSLYGVKPVRCDRAFEVEQRWWSQCGSRLFLDGQALAVPPVTQLLGVQAVAGGWLAGDRAEALLLSTGGELVDHLAYPGGREAARMGRSGDTAVVEAADGTHWSPDAQLTAWLPAQAAAPAVWQDSGTLPARWRTANEDAAPAGAPTVERVLLDVHAGRWLGPAGPWLMDLAALALITLAGTGVWTATRRRRLHQGNHS